LRTTDLEYRTVVGVFFSSEKNIYHHITHYIML